MTLTDTQASAALTSSLWEEMSRRCEEHRRAELDHVEAELEAFLRPGPYAAVLVATTEVALRRAERRLVPVRR